MNWRRKGSWARKLSEFRFRSQLALVPRVQDRQFRVHEIIDIPSDYREAMDARRCCNQRIRLSIGVSRFLAFDDEVAPCD